MSLLPQMKASTKRKLLFAISEVDEHCFKAVEIAASLGLSRACLSTELKVLLDEGLLEQREGKSLSISPKGEVEMRKSMDDLDKLSQAISSSFKMKEKESRHLARSLLEGTY